MTTAPPPLPTISVPLYNVTIPSSGKQAKFHAFTGKEEKTLLIARETDDFEQIVTAIRQVLGSCVKGVDIDDLASFDIEYLLLRIRAVSVNNIFAFTVRDHDTGEKVDVEVDVEDIKVQFPEGYSDKIKLDDDTVFVMKYPSWDALHNRPDDADFATLYLINSLKEIHSGDIVYDAKDYDNEELMKFFEGMTGDQLQKVEKYFEAIPMLRHEIKYTLKDGSERTHVLEGLQDFFF